MEQLQVSVERAVPPRRDRDHVAELPVVLGRELDPLRVGDAPHDRRRHGAAEMAMQLRDRDLAREQTRHDRRIAEAATYPAPGRSSTCQVPSWAPAASDHATEMAYTPGAHVVSSGRSEQHVRRPALALGDPAGGFRGVERGLRGEPLDRRRGDGRVRCEHDAQPAHPRQVGRRDDVVRAVGEIEPRRVVIERAASAWPAGTRRRHRPSRRGRS